MPLYEYECQSCGHRLELIQRLDDPPPQVCPSCGKGTFRKLLSAPAFHFKGSGWYVTDYGKSGSSTRSAGETQGTANDKPAATSEGKDQGKDQGKGRDKGQDKGQDKGKARSDPSPKPPAST